MRDREEARRRAHELVSRMTLEEKASQLRYDSPAIPRLGIPAYNWWNEGLHGAARAGVATSFPQAIGIAAAFDRELTEEMGRITAVEGRAKYNSSIAQGDRDIYKGLTFWSPNINIFRDPRWGRGHETYGEDPYLTAEMGKAYVQGMQGNGEYMTAAACAKHFAVHSGPEALRHEFNVHVTKKDLYETYLPAFEALVKEAEVEAVMGAYNRVDGEPCCGSRTLIKDILRDKWHFQGHFVSDCWAIADFHTRHMVTDTAEESAALALKSGCDVNCGITYLHLLKAHQDSLVTEEEIGAAAERLFTTRFLLGLFDDTEYDAIGFDRLECPEHLEAAARATAESVVLLKNDGILPLSRNSLRTIGVIGPNADSRRSLIGNYHGTSSRYITVLEGIQDYVSPDTRVYYSEGCHLFGDRVESLAQRQDRISEALSVASVSDVVILCLGLDETLEGEEGDTGNSNASGDKLDLLLPLPQRELAEAVIGTGKPVILLNMTGSAMDLRYFHDRAAAVVQTWYPGARGGRTIARILFGEISPSGKLPVTFYNSIEELPAFEDYSMKGRTYRYFQGSPLYPFGYGLTYGDAAVESVTCMGRTFRAGQNRSDSPESVPPGCAGTLSPAAEAKTSATTNMPNSASAMDKPDNDTHKDSATADRPNSNTHKDSATADRPDSVTVTVTVENRSDTAIEEVVQLYVRALDSPYAPPNPRLCAFARIPLSGRESRQTELQLYPDAFCVIDGKGEKQPGGGRFLVSAGLGQPDERTRALTGKECISFLMELPRGK